MPEIGKIVVKFANAHPFITAAAVLVGNTIIGKLMEPDPIAVDRTRITNRNVTGRSTTAGERTIYGTVQAAGYQTFIGSAGAGGVDLWEVNDFCHHEITAFDELEIDGIVIDLATDLDGSGFCTLADFIDGDGNKLLQIFERTGTDAQTVITDLDTAFSEIDTNFTGKGVAYLAYRMTQDRSSGGPDPDDPIPDVWERGKPTNFVATIRGKAIYDPRLDSTNGGTGSHRYADQTTWAHSDNPALVLRDYLTAGNGEVTTGQAAAVGFGEANARIDDALIASMANLCDETVTVWINDGVGGTTTQKRYTCNGVVESADDPRKALEALLSSIPGGTLVYQQGKWRLRGGAYETPTLTFSEPDIVGDLTLSQGDAFRTRYNAVRAIYNDPTREGQTVESQAMTDATSETTDGEQTIKTVTLPFCNSEAEAQRVALIWRKLSRFGGSFTAQMGLSALQISVGDVVSWTHTDLEMTAARFRCVSWEMQPSGRIDCSFTRESYDVWTYDAPPAPSDLVEVTRAPRIAQVGNAPDPVTGLTATASRAGILLQWTNPDMRRVRTIEVWASSSNSRTVAARIHTTLADSFDYTLAYGLTRYFWVIVRGTNNRVSAWHPVSATAGVSATSANTGDALQIVLSKDAATVTTDSSFNGNLAPAQGVLRVMRGGVDILSAVTVTVTATNCTAEFNATLDDVFTGVAGAYRITAISGQDAEIAFSVSDSGETANALFDITAIDGTPGFTAYIGGGPLNESVGNGSQTSSGSKECVPDGGVSPYTYAWSRVSGDTQVTAGSSTAKITDFDSSGTDQFRSAIFKCTVTDSTPITPNVVDSNNISVTLTHGTPA